MKNINFTIKKCDLLTIAVRAKQGCFQGLNVCKKTAIFSIFWLKKATKAPFLLKNFFQSKKVTVADVSPTEPLFFILKEPNPLNDSAYPIALHRSVKTYQNCVGKIGDLAEKITPPLENISFLNQADAWNSLSFVMKKKPKAFLTLTDRKSFRKEIKNKLDLLSACLQELDIPVPNEFTVLNSVDQTIEQLTVIYEQIEDKRTESSVLGSLLEEADDSILELRDFLHDYTQMMGKPIGEETKKIVKNTLKNNPLFAKLAPLTLISGGTALSAFLIDQQGFLPIGWNPNSYVSDAILYKVGSIFTHMSSVGDALIYQENLITVLQNATTVAGAYALATVNYSSEEKQDGYLEYIASGVINQMFAFSFAYAGARFFGSKEKVKGFVEHRISSTIAYKVCNITLDYLGVSYWFSKSISLIASSLINPLLSLAR